jgi:periplasmic copper chaperone A
MRIARRPGCRPVLLAMVVIGMVTAACGPTGGPAPLGGGTPDLHVGAAQSSAPVAGAAQLVLTIENRGDGDDRLLGADTDAALAIEIHRTVIEPGGRASMRMLDDVVLPAGGIVQFRPGDLHLMLVVPDERLTVGGTFAVTLRFERSAPATLTVPVVDLLDLVETSGPGGTGNG